MMKMGRSTSGDKTPAETPVFRDPGLMWLVISVSAICAVIFVVTALRYMSFLDLNWDLGISMQALWTNTHGYLMFESADHQTSGVLSFLEVNTAYIGIPISYLYGLFPDALTLLFIQAFIISISGFPLYLYSRKRFGDWKIPLLITLVYLTNFAVLSGVFYDFHWEAFLPMEFFSLIYLFSEKRYVLASIPVVLGALTLEVFPFIAGSYLIYAILLPSRISANPESKNNHAGFVRSAAIILLALSGIVYYILAYVGGAILPAILGTSYSSTGSAVHAVSYLFSFGVTSSTIFNSLVYWLLIFISVGFTPFLKWKNLVIVVPWFYWSVIAHPVYTAQFGVQYGIIAMLLLMVPFIEGVREILRRSNRGSLAGMRALFIGPISLIVLAFGFETTSVFINHVHLIFFTFLFLVLGVVSVLIYRTGLLDRKLLLGITKVPKKKLLSYFLVLIITVSLLIGPLNPVNKSPPFTGGYAINYGISPSFQYMGEITDLVGHNSTALSTDNLFPFIANNPKAYSFFWFPSDYSDNKYFPYNQSNLPEFLLFDSSEMFTVPSLYQYLAFNSTLYGEKMEIINSKYPGNIYLFQLGYDGRPLVYIT